MFSACFSDSIDSAIEKYGLQRVSLLRAFCQKVGIQILLREYGLDNKNKQIFFEEDIVNVTPLVKHIHPRVSKVSAIVRQGIKDRLKGIKFCTKRREVTEIQTKVNIRFGSWIQN